MWIDRVSWLKNLVSISKTNCLVGCNSRIPKLRQPQYEVLILSMRLCAGGKLEAVDATDEAAAAEAELDGALTGET